FPKSDLLHKNGKQGLLVKQAPLSHKKVRKKYLSLERRFFSSIIWNTKRDFQFTGNFCDMRIFHPTNPHFLGYDDKICVYFELGCTFLGYFKQTCI
ncbi:MAG: hypothetical protein QXS81_05355, partial [Candidatus Micrarchaeaceae archaeon]